MTPPRPLTLVIPAVLLLLLALAPASASAGVVKVVTMEDREGTYGTFDYTAAPGERNRLRIVVTKKRARVEDPAGVRAGRRCRRVSRTVATCPRNRNWFDTDVAAELGNRSDRVSVSGVHGTLLGGPGNDVLRALAKRPDVDAGSALLGGPGNDRLIGGAGRDEFHEGARRNGSDTMIGGRGFDQVSYFERKGNIRADLSGDRDDGERGERDRIAQDVEALDAGAGADRLTGNGAANEIAGGAGGDRISGLGGNDRLSGTKEVDLLDETRGTNTILGGRGDDELIGASGPDVLRPGPGFDDVSGSGGSDDLATRDQSTDLVSCDDDFGPTDGPGDGASVDNLDLVGPDAGCAQLDRLGTARGVFVGYQDETVKHILGIEAEEGKAIVNIGCSADAPDRCRGSVELIENGRSLGSAPFDVALGEESQTVEVALSSADFARADRRSGIRATLVVRPAGLEEQRLIDLLVRSREASL